MLTRNILGTSLALACSTGALAQSFTIPWSTVDCGGGTISGLHAGSGINFSVSATIGQHDAGPTTGPMTGTVSGIAFAVRGGYWVGFAAPPGCVADVDDGSGTGTRDGGVGIEDLLYYLTVYDAGTSRADVDDGTGTGTRDGGVGIEDLLYYLTRYDAGC